MRRAGLGHERAEARVAEAERGQVDAALHELRDAELRRRAARAARAAAVGLGLERPRRRDHVLVGRRAEVVVRPDRRNRGLVLAAFRRGLGARRRVGAAPDLIQVSGGATARVDPLVDLDARRLAARPEVADDQDVAAAGGGARGVRSGERP